MLRALLFFAIAAVVIWGVYLLSGVSAPITLAWGDRIFGPYAPFEAAVAATVVLVIALVVWNIVAWIFWRKPKQIVEGMGRRRREEGYKALTKGMVALATGDSREAARQHMRAEARLPADQALSRMLAAQIAEKNGDAAAAVAQFEAMTETDDTRLLGLQGLFHQARKDGDMGRALALLEEADKAAPGTPWVLDSLFRVQALAGRWDSARDSLRQLERKKLVDVEQGKHWRAVVDIEASREHAAADDGKGALKLAKEAYKSHPTFVPAAVQYAEMECRFGRVGKAEKVVYEFWGKSPHPDLVPVYETVTEIYTPQKQFEKFKALAMNRMAHPETRIMLAREAVRIGDFEEARTQLAEIGEEDLDARVCRLQADIELASGGDRAVARDWMARAAVAAPDPVWVCGESGAVATRWSAISPAGAFDSLEWRRPNYVPLAELPNPVDPTLLLEAPEPALEADAPEQAPAPEEPVEEVEAELLPAPDAEAAPAESQPAEAAPETAPAEKKETAS